MFKHNKLRIFSVLAFIMLAVVTFGAVAPALAAPVHAPALQEGTPEVPDPEITVEVVPDTGADNDAADIDYTWLILLIVGVLVVALLVGLVARGSSHTHIED